VLGPPRYARRRAALSLLLAASLCGLSTSQVPAARETAKATLDPAPDATAPVRPSLPAPSGNPLWGIPLRALSAIAERPIFSPSRRPHAPVVLALAAAEPLKPVPPPEPTHPPLVLVGTVIGESRQIGIFLKETTKEIVRLVTGEGRDGWVLRSVDKVGVQFERGGRTATLVLRPPHQNKPPGLEAAPVAELIPPVRHRKR
jgi:general secretion pathway protein N